MIDINCVLICVFSFSYLSYISSKRKYGHINNNNNIINCKVVLFTIFVFCCLLLAVCVCVCVFVCFVECVFSHLVY